MNNEVPILAKFWHRAMAAYGVATPDHPGKGSIIAALAKNAQPAWTEPVTVKRRYGTYRLDLNDMVGREIYCDTYEPCESRVVRKMIQAGWTCVDAGANIGYFSILLSKLVGPTGRVYSFEPSPDNLESLATNLRLSEAANVTVQAAALSDHIGKAGFATNRRGNLGGSMLDDEGPEIVTLTTLDAFMEGHPGEKVDFIKIDIEGSEVACLRGAEGTLKRDRPSILVEINPNALLKHQTSAGELRSYLEKNGYRLQKITWAGLKSEGPDPPPGGYCNVIATPK